MDQHLTRPQDDASELEPKPRRLSASRRAWQLPRGVGSGTWDYLAEPTIATEYDRYHGDHPLMQLDSQLVEQCLGSFAPDRTLVADFGCGTARISRRIGPRGYRTLNVDLSAHMLRSAMQHMTGLDRAAFVRSNLVELEWLVDQSVDVALCLFSSMGMIRGRANRQAFLKHVRRSLKPLGMLVLHVHNRGHSWFDPEGPWWLVSTRLKSWLSRQWEYGDRIYPYRGLPQMYLHIYSQRELRADLRAAGFERFDVLPIDVTGSRLLAPNTVACRFRAGGFFVTARV